MGNHSLRLSEVLCSRLQFQILVLFQYIIPFFSKLMKDVSDVAVIGALRVKGFFFMYNYSLIELCHDKIAFGDMSLINKM